VIVINVSHCSSLLSFYISVFLCHWNWNIIQDQLIPKTLWHTTSRQHQWIIKRTRSSSAQLETGTVSQKKLYLHPLLNPSGTTVWVQKNPPPEIFWHFFPNGWELLVQILLAYYPFLSTLDYKFLFNYLRLPDTSDLGHFGPKTFRT